jgi:predicted Zn finger-like uncharacterized protein
MRLICPNCGAQYEVADDVIPQDGRDVQCSNCGHTWFENFGASDVEDEFLDTSAELSTQTIHEDAATWDDVADTAPESKEPQKQELDPAIADILREEAAREADARRRETEAALESQPDLGLDTAAAPDRRAQETERRIALLKGEEVAADQAELAAASRRELLPDIEEINSSLRSDAERATTDTPTEVVKNRRSFRSGFFGVLLILIFLTALYVFAPQISDMVPALAPTLDSYVATVDGLRLWIDLKLQGIVNTMNADG